jgi:hypothetical protein
MLLATGNNALATASASAGTAVAPLAAASTAAAHCSLTREELQKYPDSLLSSIASACSSDDNGSSRSSSSFVKVDLNEVAGWPCELVKPTEAAAVITALYRCDHEQCKMREFNSRG